jgi:UDPglucose--hexose-1-phosphate uridylyltransferase
MTSIQFDSWQQTAHFHNPLHGGVLDAQQIEVRLDPLTGHQSVFNAALEDKAGILFPDTDPGYLRQRAAETRTQCFLCEARWRHTTPRYPETLIPGGRMERGAAVLFPNLFPLAAYHAVVMLDDEHFRTLDNFPAELLGDALGVALDFIGRCHQVDPRALYFTINANYLFPAGASVLHPHLQVLGGPHPGTHHRLLLERSQHYLLETGSCYWSDLASAEENGPRFLGKLGSSRWLTAFSPMGANEVNGVWPTASHFLEWGDEDIRTMAEGLSRILQAYHALNFSTFNFSCFSGPLDRTSPEFRCLVRLINRQNAAPHYRTDDFYFQKLLRNEIIIRRPEHLAAFIRSTFAISTSGARHYDVP